MFGDILSKAGEVTLETADGISVSVGRNLIERIGIKVLGIPHIGLRCRAYCILRLLGCVNKELVASKSMGHVKQGYGQNEICSLMEESGLRPVRVIGYCSMIGKIAWKLNRKAFKSKLLTALTFWPLYASAIFDLYLDRSKPGMGWVIKAVKEMSS